MMMPPEHTLRFESFDLCDLLEGEVVISNSSLNDDRGIAHIWESLARTNTNRLITLEVKSPNTARATTDDGSTQDISLTDEQQLASLTISDSILIDITTLPYQIWVPIFRANSKAGKKIRVLYVEPDDYKTHPSPSSPNRFDLSISFEGLSPLPGFVNLSGPPDDDLTLFVPFLGFEGSRAERIANQLEPQPKVIPVIGVPGFQVNYPSITVISNRQFLSQFDCNANIRLAKASCPFEAYDTLVSIHGDFPEHYIYIGLIGTRPHALGAIFYAIKNEERCEILFDHPVRQNNRTTGQGLIHVYDFSINDYPDRS